MRTGNTSLLPQIHPPLGRAFPKAKSGALGAFIERNLASYIEPTREGTPKGVPVGLSLQKYHAAVLAGMTRLDLRKIAREVRVSYALLRKWRTEDPFCAAGYQAIVEFVDHEFDVAAKASLGLITGHGQLAPNTETPIALAKRIQDEKLVGFDDAVLYGDDLLRHIDVVLTEHLTTLVAHFKHLQPNQEPDLSVFREAGNYLSLAYVLDQIGRVAVSATDKRARGTLAERQRRTASRLSGLIDLALSARPAHQSLQDFACAATKVQRALLA